MFIYHYRRFMKWTGLNRSTSHHVRIRGYAVSRFTVAVLIGAIGFGLIHLGILMEPNGWDVWSFFVGVAISLFGVKVMRPWILDEDQKSARRWIR